MRSSPNSKVALVGVVAIVLAVAAFAVLAIPTTSTQADPDVAAKLRFLSFATRDTPPTLEETRALASGATTLDALTATWLETDAHRAKIKRFFYDMFGTGYHTPGAGLNLKMSELGVYYLEERGSCAMADAVEVDAWWVDAPGTVKICPTSTSTDIHFGTPFVDEIACTLPSTLYDEARCGCGPSLIGCFPEAEAPRMWAFLYENFTERGLLAYDEDRTWLELFAGETFYGNRSSYYLYMWTGYVYNSGLPHADDVATLRSLPMDERAEAPYPVGATVERAPVATDPHFLIQYNNFRSRIRALSEKLLCQDISSALNTDGIDHFVNPDLGAFNTDHGTKDGCSDCHLAMDNMGSTLLAWGDMGTLYNTLPSPTGHVFGEEGDGAPFLMQGMVERGPGFQRCMAKRAYETFTGAAFDELAAETQAEIEAMAATGPRTLIRSLLTSPLVPALR